MIVVGAKGLAKEILQILEENNDVENLFFFDDINLGMSQKLYDKYHILIYYDFCHNSFFTFK